MKKNDLMKYDLQFFAEEPEPNQEPEPAQEPQLTVEEQLTHLMAESKKWKAQFDKASAEAANYKKQYRETLSQKEQMDLEKAERDAAMQTEFNDMKKQLAIIGLEKNFLNLGYDEKTANKAANAQFEGDTDELFKIQQTFLSARDSKLKAEWMKSQPIPPSGNGEYGNVTKEQFEQMSYLERCELYEKDRETYNKLNS